MLSYLKPVSNALTPFLPEGTLITLRPPAKDSGPMRIVELQGPTLDETPDTRLVRALNVRMEKANHDSAAQTRLAEFSVTQSPYQASPVQGTELGHLCYHSAGFGGAREVYVRANVVVVQHCMGPTNIRKTPFTRGVDPRYVIGKRTKFPRFVRK